MRILSGIDFLLLPFFLLVFYGIFVSIANRRYLGSELRSYFINAWTARVVGAFLTAMMYQYYYAYGDTFFYYIGASDMVRASFSNVSVGLEMLTEDYHNWSNQAKMHLTYHGFFDDDAAVLVMKTAAFFGFFTFGSYFGMSLGLTAFAFAGCWRLYRVFHDIYPHLHRQLAWAILFVPSICFWGTGVMKDSLTLGALGFFVNGCYFLLIKRQRLISSAFWVILGAYIMTRIKIYIFISIAPAIIVWVALMYQKRIKSNALRLVFGPVFLLLGAGGGLFALQQVSSLSNSYSLENVLTQAAKTQWWISYSTERDGGTGYDLGTFDPSLSGLIQVLPKAINVSLFRPYLWEARKPIVMPSALEAIFTLIFTLRVIYVVGITRLLRAIFSDPVVPFCLVFALFFAFAVGFTTLNFGALARYKIPCLPFYFTALIILLDNAKQKQLSG